MFCPNIYSYFGGKILSVSVGEISAQGSFGLICTGYKMTGTVMLCVCIHMCNIDLKIYSPPSLLQNMLTLQYTDGFSIFFHLQ